MSTIRQDAWSEDDDLILAEVVLRHIREGSTQLAAFEEVGERLSRTSAACGFRWNSIIRKKYESAIALARKQRVEGGKKKINEKVVESSSATHLRPKERLEENTDSNDITMEQVIKFLMDEQKRHEEIGEAESIAQLQEENEKLKLELEEEKKRNAIMQEDYRTLVTILNRARELST